MPKYGRPCNGLSWNHDETNLVAVALDKHRSDHCIQVWDANRSSLSADEITGMHKILLKRDMGIVSTLILLLITKFKFQWNYS